MGKRDAYRRIQTRDLLQSRREKRERKLLLTHKELIKLQRKVKESGLTIVPVKVFLNEKGYAKLRIALAKGKKGIRQTGKPETERCQERYGEGDEKVKG